MTLNASETGLPAFATATSRAKAVAIYHLNVKVGSRSSGHSAGAKHDQVCREGKYAKDKDGQGRDLHPIGQMPSCRGFCVHLSTRSSLHSLLCFFGSQLMPRQMARVYASLVETRPLVVPLIGNGRKAGNRSLFWSYGLQDGYTGEAIWFRNE